MEDLISKSKALEWLDEKISVTGDVKCSAYKSVRDEILYGTFSPDPIPLPTIKPGDKVRHKTNKSRQLGVVKDVSKCGQGVLVKWSGYGHVKEESLSDLEVSHD